MRSVFSSAFRRCRCLLAQGHKTHARPPNWRSASSRTWHFAIGMLGATGRQRDAIWIQTWLAPHDLLLLLLLVKPKDGMRVPGGDARALSRGSGWRIVVFRTRRGVTVGCQFDVKCRWLHMKLASRKSRAAATGRKSRAICALVFCPILSLSAPPVLHR